MLRSLIRFEPRDVPLRVALRNAAAIVLPLGIGVATGHVAVGVGVATGALNTMFTDQPGAYRQRLRRMLLTALAASASAFVGSLLGASTPMLALAALLWGLCGGLLVALGPEAGRAGLTSMILLIVMGAEPRDAGGALGAALLIFAGGTLQTAFAIAAWPLGRYGPERESLAALCRQLARAARGRSDPTEAPPQTRALLDLESQLHGSDRAPGPVMERFRVLAALLERARLELLALADLHDEASRATIERLQEYAARAFEAIAEGLERGASPLAANAAMEGFDAALGALLALRDGSRVPRERALRAVAVVRAEVLAGQLRAVIRNAAYAGSRGELRELSAEHGLPRRLRPRDAIGVLRANLALSSVAFRHALRCGACLAIAVVVERALGLPHGYWIPMTIAIVLKPDYAGTFRHGLLRVAGTLGGLVLATALVHYAFGSDWEQLALLGLLCAGYRLLVTVHYGIGVALLTAAVVVLLSFHGIEPGETMQARGSASIAGSLLALAAYALWPTREHRQVRPALAGMLDAYRVYFHDLLRGDAATRARSRRVARSARSNAEASLSRMRGEPGADRRLLALADALFANANRLIRASMLLEAALGEAASRPAGIDLLAFASEVEARMQALATSLRDGHAPASAFLRRQERALAAALGDCGEEASAHRAAIAEALDRITDALDSIAHLLANRPRFAS